MATYLTKKWTSSISFFTHLPLIVGPRFLKMGFPIAPEYVNGPKCDETKLTFLVTGCFQRLPLFIFVILFVIAWFIGKLGIPHPLLHQKKNK